MTFDTQLGHALVNIFGYRAIAILMIHRHMMDYAVPRVQLHRFCATGISITIVNL